MLDVFIEQSPERRSFHFGAWNFLVELHQNCLRWGTSWGLRFDWRLCSIVTNVTAAGYILRPLLRIAPASACLLRGPDRCPMRFVDTRVNLHCRLLPERILADCRNEIEALRNVA
jgi:hypothetical protein